MSTVPMPPFPSGTVQDQIMQLYSYLFSMAQTLNVLIANIDDTKGGGE